MKIILVQPVSLSIALEDGSAFACLHKTVVSDLRPQCGDLIEDPAFKGYPANPEVVKVTLDYDADTCYASIRVLELASEDPEYLKRYVSQAEANGWIQTPRPKQSPPIG